MDILNETDTMDILNETDTMDILNKTDTTEILNTRTNAPAPQQKICFDNDGDLTLIVGTSEHEFLVCSRALSRTSHVFRRMLNGGFSESRPSNAAEPWVVKLPEDSAWAAEQVFYIVHSRFRDVLTVYTLPDVHAILVFTEKYDMTVCLRPWIRPWMSAQAALSQNHSSSKLIGVAWELGVDGNLALVGKKLVLETRVDSDGNLIFPLFSELGYPSAAPLIPPLFLEQVAADRQALIYAIVSRLNFNIALLHKLVQGTTTSASSYCRGSSSTLKRAACHAMTLGIIISGLEQPELKARDNVPYPFSVEQLVRAISSIRNDLHPGVLHDKLSHSKECSPLPKIIAGVQELIRSQKAPLTQEHIVYMVAQREKLAVRWQEPANSECNWNPA